MRIPSLLALVGLAISFALPTFAQQKDTPDPQLRQRLIALIKIHTDALDKNDAAAIAANFTEDGILSHRKERFSVERASRNIMRTTSNNKSI